MELFIPYVYDPSKSTTDMQNMPKYCLKLYGMNLEDFFRLLKGEPLEPRGGSAAIQGQYDAFGIPTGHKKGFTSLQEILVMHDGIRTTVQAVLNLTFHGGGARTSKSLFYPIFALSTRLVGLRPYVINNSLAAVVTELGLTQ